MEIFLYPRLSTRSKRAMLKTKGRFGRYYSYQPRITLIDRLARETGLSREEVMNQLWRERQFLLDVT